jgi:hypothetical protein
MKTLRWTLAAMIAAWVALIAAVPEADAQIFRGRFHIFRRHRFVDPAPVEQPAKVTEPAKVTDLAKPLPTGKSGLSEKDAFDLASEAYI